VSFCFLQFARRQNKSGVITPLGQNWEVLKKMNPRSQKYIVGWDFSKKPSGTFYRVILDEFGTSHPGGDYELIQRSVALCRDDFVASRLTALAEHFGARVASFRVEREGIPQDSAREARAFVERVLYQRLHRRGRRARKR
jgi:hypothetical protein